VQPPSSTELFLAPVILLETARGKIMFVLLTILTALIASMFIISIVSTIRELKSEASGRHASDRRSFPL
jgi:hypothetical protein